MRLKKSGWMVTEDIVVRICGETETLTMNMTFSKLWETEKGREAWHAAKRGCKESDTTERLNNKKTGNIWAEILLSGGGGT